VGQVIWYKGKTANYLMIHFIEKEILLPLLQTQLQVEILKVVEFYDDPKSEGIRQTE
jgi:hypothetical protein